MGQKTSNGLLMMDLSAFFDLAQEALLSQPYDASPTHDGFRFRALRRARKIAEVLIDQKGEFDKKNLGLLLSSIEAQGWIYHPKGLSDGAITEHFLLVLRQLKDPVVMGALRSFQLPLCHRFAEDLVRRTLGIPLSQKLRVAEVRRSVLTACLTPLRQNVGSCFATAPAILIQRQQLQLFLQDLSQLLNTGRIIRVFEGISYGVPLSPHSGRGADELLENALLKSWEYTLASFSEVKMEFTQWNLCTSLGLHHQEIGGIGAVIYGQVEEKIELANEKVKEFQAEYEIAASQLRATEQLLSQASSEDQIRRLQAEYRSRSHHMNACVDMRDQFYAQGSFSSKLYSILVEQYAQLFPEYFQEIYDAEMQEFNNELMEDSPAGFRLLYKHGRRDPSQWTLIYTEDQFVQALVDFFSATESQIASVCDWKGGQEEVFQITSAIIHHLRSSAFIESAKERAERSRFKEPGQKTPWGYTSGGTLTTLVKTYYRRASELTVEEKWVENETELIIFFIDALKLAPPLVTDRFVKDPYLGMLAHSPTHAFVLRPGFKLFAQGWQEEGFTYTWVRDQIFIPSQQFFSPMRLDQEVQTFLFHQLMLTLPSLLAHQLRQTELPPHRTLSAKEWRDEVLRMTDLGSERVFIDQLDAFLYKALPVISSKEAPIYLRRLFSDKMDERLEEEIGSLSLSGWMTACEIRELAKELYVKVYPSRCYGFDVHQYVADHARFVGLLSPTPLLVADSNWTGYYFGFVVNPGTGRLELWRLDRTGAEGLPMSTWKPWLNGQERKPWAVFVRPGEYG